VRFERQEGYFAYSVSRSQVPTVMRYIANQKEHHHEIDSAMELELLLKRHGFELRIEVARGVCAVPNGTRNSLFPFPVPALPCRATDCCVPSGLNS
jgi:hypothetical protein